MFGIQTRQRRISEIQRVLRDSVSQGGWLYNLLGDGYGVDPRVDAASAMKIPAVWAAINILSSELAAMPIKLYQTDSKQEVTDSETGRLLSTYPNPYCTSYEYRLEAWTDVFTVGCHASWIERSADGQPRYLWRLDPAELRVEYADDGIRPVFKYRSNKRTGSQIYDVGDIIYLTFTRKRDAITPISPIDCFRLVLKQALSSMEYSIKLYKNGGVPPLVLTGPIATSGGLQRAGDDIEQLLENMSKEDRRVLPIPEGHELKEMAVDPQKLQNIEREKWTVSQASRIWQVPASMLGDTTQATYSNMEQEDLKFAKHTLVRWAVALEGQSNLKLLGYNDSGQYFKHDMSAVLRGDRKTRIEANARAIQTGQMTPDEARELDDRAPVTGGDKAYIQGATIPLEQSGTMQPAQQPAGGGQE